MPFPYVKGAVFRFTMRDLKRLRERFGELYVGKFQEACRVHDADVVDSFVQMGWKGEGGSDAPKVNFDDPPWNLSAVYDPIMNALLFSITGKTAEEIDAAKAAEDEAFKEKVKAEFPELGPSDGPVTSSTEPAGPAIDSV